MPPGRAQGIRAVFGAVLWHAGIIHDAMACAAYLRFKKQAPKFSVSLDSTTKPCQGGISTRTELGIESKSTSDLSVNHADEGEYIDNIDKELEGKVEVIRRSATRRADAKGSSQRHSVEITSAARFLKENPEYNMQPLDLQMSNDVQSQDQPTASSEKRKNSTEIDYEEFPTVIALQKIWTYVKKNCSDFAMRNIADGSLDLFSKSKNPKFKKDRKISRGVAAEQKLKTKKDKPKELQTVGRSFLLGII